ATNGRSLVNSWHESCIDGHLDAENRVTIGFSRRLASRRSTMTSQRLPFERAMALAALSGFKLALGPAFLAAARHSPSVRSWALAALGEMMLDKIWSFPLRFRPGFAIPHALAGAWVARESLRDDGIEDPLAPVAGAAVAAGVSCVAHVARTSLRRGLGI